MSNKTKGWALISVGILMMAGAAGLTWTPMAALGVIGGWAIAIGLGFIS